MNYNFIDFDNGTDTETDQSDERLPLNVRKWTLGDHAMSVDVSPNDLLDDAEQNEGINDELAGVLSHAASMVAQSRVLDFECPVCGLNHGHPDRKHDIRSAFNVEPAFADQMKMCPYCHCGVNELAMLVDFFHYITEPVFTDQHEFEGVLELSPNTLRDIIDATNEVTYSEAAEAGVGLQNMTVESYLSLSDAATWVANERGVAEAEPVPDDIMDDLETFYGRISRIKQAAEHAPIPQTARTTIEEARSGIVTTIE